MAHAGRLSPYQQAQLFTGGLPDHIRVDVELHDPQDLQRAMRLARAYERRNTPAPLALPVPSGRPPRRNAGTAPALTEPAGSQGSSASASSAPAVTTRPFKRLSPEEMAECRKQGLCYNYDEQYVHGYKCARLFYLEASDYIVEEPDDADEEPAALAATNQLPFNPDAPMISLSAITGIRTEDTMQLYIQIGNEQLLRSWI